MTDNTQPEAVADCIFRLRGLRHVDRHEVARAMESMVARIADLEAIVAGGVSGPMVGQPQAMPDLSQLTERGAVAWAGVDAQGLREGATDMSKERDAFERALTELAARYDEAIQPSEFSRDDTGAYHNALTEISWMLWQAHTSLSANAGFTAADMATAAAQGFRDGVASLSASAVGEPGASRAFLERALSAMEGVIDVADRNTTEFDALRSCVVDLTLMLFKPQACHPPPTSAEGVGHAD